MIPVLWRYAIRNYLKIFTLSVGSIVLVLIVSRFKEIAHFAVLSADWPKTVLFTLYQIPFILPMALPLSALLASFLLLQKMSRFHEIAALRAAGFGLRHILAPLMFLGGLLSLLNFSLSAQIAPHCIRESLKILYQDAPPNPLVLLQRRKLLKHKNIYIQLQEKEDRVTDLLLIARNGSNHRLELISAGCLQMEDHQLIGKKMALVSHLHGTRSSLVNSEALKNLPNLTACRITSDSLEFDPLFIENQTTMSMAATALSAFLTKSPPKTTIRSLDFRMLPRAYNHDKKKAKAAFSELLRRCSLSLAVFSFTFLGCAFGFESEKSHSKKGLYIMLFLALLLLSSYFLGKGLRSNSILAAVSIFFPHFVIWFASLTRLRRIAKGMAS